MPIDFSSSVNNISGKVFGTSIINKYLSSTLVVAFLITFILIIIIMLFYPAKENTPIKILFKVGLYSFLSSALILFLHNGVIKSNMTNNVMDENNEKIIQNLTNSNRDIIYNNKIPIKPNITGGNDEDEDEDTSIENKLDGSQLDGSQLNGNQLNGNQLNGNQLVKQHNHLGSQTNQLVNQHNQLSDNQDEMFGGNIRPPKIKKNIFHKNI